MSFQSSSLIVATLPVVALALTAPGLRAGAAAERAPARAAAPDPVRAPATISATASRLPPRPAATRVLAPALVRRIQANKGLTLQWIGWNRRGTATVSPRDGVWHLIGLQAERNGPGRLALNGTITEIGADYMLFDGTIQIDDTPDRGRRCSATRTWRFAITQGRPYLRLREFEWCDGLTDYIDLYL